VAEQALVQEQEDPSFAKLILGLNRNLRANLQKDTPQVFGTKRYPQERSKLGLASFLAGERTQRPRGISFTRQVWQEWINYIANTGNCVALKSSHTRFPVRLYFMVMNCEGAFHPSTSRLGGNFFSEARKAAVTWRVSPGNNAK